MGENLPQFSGWNFPKFFELPPPSWMYPYQRTPMGNPYKSHIYIYGKYPVIIYTQPNNDHLPNPLDFRPATNNKPLATSAYLFCRIKTILWNQKESSLRISPPTSLTSNNTSSIDCFLFLHLCFQNHGCIHVYNFIFFVVTKDNQYPYIPGLFLATLRPRGTLLIFPNLNPPSTRWGNLTRKNLAIGESHKMWNTT